MTLKVTAEQQTRFLARNAVTVLAPFLAGFVPDPGTSDLDDEQPIWIHATLGEYRKARNFMRHLEKTV